jgi:dTDP-4-amino-4,6-dideoxygalactose transaminase
MVGPGADCFGEEERAQVLDVLSSGHLSRYGDLADPRFKHKVFDLEREFAQHCGTEFAVATNSGTSALLLSLLALGIGEGDEVLVPGFSYVATYAAIIHTRAVPVLVEIDESLTIDPVDLEAKVTPRTRAVVVVHMLGNQCDMTSIMSLAARHDIRVIEDACQAAGATYHGQRVGSFGQIAAFSFNRYKLISAGEGGMVTVSDPALRERVFAIHDQGHLPSGATKVPSDLSLVGLNLKMTELTGAVALAQLRKLDRILKVLRERKAMLVEQLPALSGTRRRHLNDESGECATFYTTIFDDPDHARAVATALGARPMSETGWHNYRLMSQITAHRTPLLNWSAPARFARPGDLPRTDDLLARSVSISIGVVDKGLGSTFGLNVLSDDAQVAEVAERFAMAVSRGTSVR